MNRQAMTPKVAIVLLNWNGWRDTIACLDSLRRLDHSPVGVFVCDNASTDASVAEIVRWGAALNADEETSPAGTRRLSAFHHRKAAPGGGAGGDWPPRNGSADAVTLIETGGNIGFAAGSNVGLRFALKEDYDLFWLLNNDTEVDADTLTYLVRRMEAEPAIGMCGSTIVYAAQPTLVQVLGGGEFDRLKGRGHALGFRTSVSDPIDQAAIEARMTFVNGASMIVSRRFIEEIGLMDEDYFLYFEENDWAERCRDRFKLGFEPRSIVRHKVGASIGTDDFGLPSALSLYYLTRSRIRFCRRFHKLSLPFVAAEVCRDIYNEARRRNWSRIRVIARAVLNRPYQRSAATQA